MYIYVVDTVLVVSVLSMHFVTIISIYHSGDCISYCCFNPLESQEGLPTKLALYTLQYIRRLQALYGYISPQSKVIYPGSLPGNLTFRLLGSCCNVYIQSLKQKLRCYHTLNLCA